MSPPDERKCMKCEARVFSQNHDLCYDCYTILKGEEKNKDSEDSFNEDLKENRIYTVYVMFYGDKRKIGFTNDLGSRYIELKRVFPENKLVYFREFTKESEAREFELWVTSSHTLKCGASCV